MNRYLRLLFIFLVYICSSCAHKRSHHTHTSIKKSNVQHSKTTPSLEHSMPWKEISKKSLIQHGNENRLQKRGFLANLANLLNDAEAISDHKKSDESVVNSEDAKLSDAHDSFSLGNIAVKKENIDSNSVKEITEVVDESGKDFAPVFAMYHGKVVTLGKLPDTAFKKSHEEGKQSSSTVVNQPEKHMKDVSASKRYLDENRAVDHLAKRDSQMDSTERIQDYLKTLDPSKDQTGTAKDDVPGSSFSTVESLPKNGDLLGHIKSVVLDNGKVVSLNNNRLTQEVSPTKIHSDLTSIADTEQKYHVTNDGNVEPLVKSRPENVDAVTRDNLLDGTSGQKTVTLTVDVLKDLLKRTDSKVSLANLLNKPEVKSDTPQEDEDPGTIEDFAAGGLKSHNEYRAKHHGEPLLWSDELAAKAQKLAEALADKKTLEIAKDLEKDGMGENVAKVWATFKNAGDAATKMWYSQSSNYRFDDPHLDENTGQFAQVVWKSTRELGMGVAKSIDDVNNKYVYVTALYRPPGNIETTLRDNVLPTGNNTEDVYSTFFKRTGVSKSLNHNTKRSKIARHKNVDSKP